MVQFLYQLTYRLKDKNCFMWKILYKFSRFYVSFFYPITQKNNKNSGINISSEFIVSLTSYPARINTVWIAIASIMNQKLKPQKIILWLAKEQFENGLDDLPKQLKKQMERGLEIEFCDDLRPHKKYFYAIQKYNDSCVITVDDDVVYPENHLNNIWNKHHEFPDAVVCHTAHLLAFEEGKIQSYEKWKHAVPGNLRPNYLLVPVGCGGVLYPPSCFHKEAFNKDMIISTSLNMDDIWLKFMEIINGISAVRILNNEMNCFTLIGSDSNGLYKQNVGNSKNDEAIRKIVNIYPTIESILASHNN